MTNPDLNKTRRAVMGPHSWSDGTNDPHLPAQFVAADVVFEITGKRGFEKLVKMGGDCCDCCHKKEDDGLKLMKCSRCMKGYYCSEKCQKKSWKVYGHKEYCRKDGEIKAGDLVRLDGLQQEPQLNNLIVKVVRPDPKKEKKVGSMVPDFGTGLIDS